LWINLHEVNSTKFLSLEQGKIIGSSDPHWSSLAVLAVLGACDQVISKNKFWFIEASWIDGGGFVSRIDLCNIIEVTFNRFPLIFIIGMPNL